MIQNPANVFRWTIVASLLAVGGWSVGRELTFRIFEPELHRASEHLVDHDFGAARESILRVLEQDGVDDHTNLVAGLILAGTHENEASLRRLNLVSDADPRLYAAARSEAAVRSFRSGRMTEAEEYFREALELIPHDVATCREFSDMLVLQGRTWEALALVHRLFRRGLRQKQQVLKAAAIDGTFAVNEEYYEICRAACPDDPIVDLAEARRDLLKNRVPEARLSLEKILAVHPDLTEAQVRLGRILLQTDSDDFLGWHDAHASQSEWHPEVWCLRGLYTERLNQPAAAIGYYLEALRQYPDHQEANARLSQLLGQHGYRDVAEQLGQRAKDIGQMVYLSSELSGKPRTPMIQESAELMFRNGRYWEAAGWCQTYMNFFDDPDEWALEFLERVRPRLADPLVASASPSLIPQDLTDNFPLFDFDSLPHQDLAESVPSTGAERRAAIRFENIAPEIGLEFEYVNGGSERGGLEHMLQSTGGGIGVLDFDMDSWPDLYFGQSNRWFDTTDETTYRDVLFRNIRGQRVLNCTATAIEADADFSQGIACGDWNSDGFPDLLVTNVGANRLFLNCGDGTFVEQTPESLSQKNTWSISAAFADLNDDGLSDLYVVNYLVLSEVLARMCKRKDRPMGCAPTMFPAEQDRLYLNAGNGEVADVTEESGIVTADGKGLGIVIADIDNAGGLELFVGNDTTANFLFQKDRESAELRFRESAALAGIAFDEGGNAQSCMGIGLDDADNDGLLDVFVTNFFADANTMYLQTAPNIFRDATRDCQLRDSGFNMLGFGCQFLDADLDGWRDLIVTNGHVDRTFATGAPDVMTPQLYYNLGHAAYRELQGADVGDYFEHKALGRTIVLLDWNRDGREDFSVSHIDRPAALLQNSTPETGNSLRIRLIGHESERIPVGTRVAVKTQTQTLVRQLAGGAGYEGTSEPVLIFGVGSATSAAIEITWPNGDQTQFSSIELPASIDVVQGRLHWYELAD